MTTKYLPKHLATRAGHADSARLGAAAARGSRSAVAVGVGLAMPTGAAAFMAAPALAAEDAKPAAPATTNPTPVLSFGAHSAQVKTVQQRLALVADGWYGPVTTAAIKDFQRANGLAVDGVVGVKTWAALQQSSVKASSGDSVLNLGDQGPLVRAVQSKLGVGVDGVFGPKTEAAVKAFQRGAGLVADGVVGVKTTYALAHADAVSGTKKAPAKPRASRSASRASTLVHPNAQYELPFLNGYAAPVTQGPFGSASHHKWNDKHAIDWGVPTGTPVVASASGVVFNAVHDPMGGNSILIRDASGYCMEYAHLSSMNVHAGQRISQGQRIALSGATGHVTGPHLHWGIVDCSSYTSIKIPDSKERGTSYFTGAVGVSRNGA